MSSAFDTVVVGAGPGGLAAAASAAEAGKRVCVVDDNAAVGGQIWRGASGAGAKWQRRLERCGVTMRLGWRVYDVLRSSQCAPASVCVENDGVRDAIGYSSLVVATGARELFLPFPGWTRQGIYGVGGLQALVKSGFDISGKRLVIAGTGTLLLAVAAHLRTAGARVLCIVEQTQFVRMAQLAAELAVSHPGKITEGLGYSMRTLGVRYRTGSWVTRALGQQRIEAVEIRSGSRTIQIEADMLAMGFSLVPNTELARLIGCELRDGFVVVNDAQQTSVPGVYCVGEATGIGGVEKALSEGTIAGLAASGHDLAPSHASARAKPLRFAQRLAKAFSLREELQQLADNETIVCRCEDVTRGALALCDSWRAAKLHTRCGMGPCQGRICGPAVEFLFGWQTPPPRPPLFPVDVALLADSSSQKLPDHDSQPA